MISWFSFVIIFLHDSSPADFFLKKKLSLDFCTRCPSPLPIAVAPLRCPSLLPVAVACCHCTLLLAIDILNTHQCSPLTIAFAHYPCRCECKFFTCDDESMWTGLWEQEHFWLSLVKFFYGDQTARLFFSACLLSIFFK